MESRAGSEFMRAYVGRTMAYLEWHHAHEHARWIRRRRVEKLHGADNTYERCYDCGEIWAPNQASECVCENQRVASSVVLVAAGTKRSRE